jgi:hypothetical protein
MKKLQAIFIAALSTIIIVSCCKEGIDGEATLVVKMKHHGTIIPNHANYLDSVFVKFDAKELPGTGASDFDAVFVGEEGEDHIHLEGLKCGNYYIYGAGIDSSGPFRVTGGMAVKIKHSERKEEIDVDLAVTE